MVSVGLSSSGNVLVGLFSRVWCLQSGVPITKTINTTTATITAATLVNLSSACNSLLCFYPTFPFWSKKGREKERCMKIIDKTTLSPLYQSCVFLFAVQQCSGFLCQTFCFGLAANNSCGVPVPKQLITVWFEIKNRSRHFYL